MSKPSDEAVKRSEAMGLDTIQFFANEAARLRAVGVEMIFGQRASYEKEDQQREMCALYSTTGGEYPSLMAILRSPMQATNWLCASGRWESGDYITVHLTREGAIEIALVDIWAAAKYRAERREHDLKIEAGQLGYDLVKRTAHGFKIGDKVLYLMTSDKSADYVEVPCDIVSLSRREWHGATTFTVVDRKTNMAHLVEYREGSSVIRHDPKFLTTSGPAERPKIGDRVNILSDPDGAKPLVTLYDGIVVNYEDSSDTYAVRRIGSSDTKMYPPSRLVILKRV